MPRRPLRRRQREQQGSHADQYSVAAAGESSRLLAPPSDGPLRLQLLLIRSRRLIVSKILEEQVFQDDKYSSILFKGPVIALEFSSCIDTCCDVALHEIRYGIASEDVVYVSSTPELAAEQAELMFNAAA